MLKKLMITVLSVVMVLSMVFATSCGSDVDYDEEGNTFFSISFETKSGKTCTFSATLYKTLTNGQLETETYYGTAPDIKTVYAQQIDLVVVKDTSFETLNVTIRKGKKVVSQKSISTPGGNETLIGV